MEIESQLATTGQCTVPEPHRLETRFGDLALIDEGAA
jgi:hypothetical protein